MPRIFKNKNIVQSIFIFLLGLSLAGYSIYSFYTSRVKVAWIMSPYLFSLLVSIFTILVAISLFFEALNEFKYKPNTADNAFLHESTSEKQAEDNKKGINLSIALFIISSILFYILIPILRFIPASILYLIALLYIMGARKFWVIALISVLSPFVIYIIFSVILNVRLP